MTTSLIELLKELEAKASPKPWFLDGFDLHDAGTWMVGVMAREGNPSATKADPRATAFLAVLAVNHLDPLVAALEKLPSDSKWPLLSERNRAHTYVVLAAVRQAVEKALAQ